MKSVMDLFEWLKMMGARILRDGLRPPQDERKVAGERGITKRAVYPSARPEEQPTAASRRIRAQQCVLLLTLTCCRASATLVQTAPVALTFDSVVSTSLSGAPVMYLGAGKSVLSIKDPNDVTTAQPYKLSRIMATSSTAGVLSSPILQPFAPAESGGANPLATAGTVVGKLALVGGTMPVYAATVYDNSGNATFGGLNLVTDLQAGAQVTQVATTINGSDGNTSTAPVTALAAGNNFIFASTSGTAAGVTPVVSPGVAVFARQAPAAAAAGEAAAPSGPTFTQINPTNGTTTNAAALPVDLSGAGPQLLGILGQGQPQPPALQTGNQASMCWDEKLQRLYVGFTDVRRLDPTKPGGALGVLMVYPEFDGGGALLDVTAAPIVDVPNLSKFYQGVAVAAEAAAPNYSLSLTTPVSQPGIAQALALLTAVRKYTANPANAASTGDAMITAVAALPGLAGTITNAGNAAAAAAVILGLNVANAGGGNNLNTQAAKTPLLTAVEARVRALLTQATTAYKNTPATAVANLATNAIDRIIGFYADGSTPRRGLFGIPQAHADGFAEFAVSVPNLAVMHTSTGNPYLIINSAVSTGPSVNGSVLYSEAENWVYALPLIPDAREGAAYLKGSLAAVGVNGVAVVANGAYSTPADITQMPKKSLPAILVGGGNPVPGSFVQQIFVDGDTVYAALAGFAGQFCGLFKSTAVLNKDGLIAGWTPAQRVFSNERVFGGLVDATTGLSYALTSTTGARAGSAAATTAQISQWGSSNPDQHGGSNSTLDAVLGNIFPSAQGGVQQLVVVDENMVGVKPDSWSGLIALGYDKLAFVRTSQAGTAETEFVQGAGGNVTVFSDAALGDIKPLTCACIGYSTAVAAPPPVGTKESYIIAGGVSGAKIMRFNYGSEPTGAFADLGVAGGEAVVAVGQVRMDSVAGPAPVNNVFHLVTSTRVYVFNGGGGLVPVPGANVTATLPLTGSATSAFFTTAGSFVATTSGVYFISAAGGASISLGLPAGINCMQLVGVAARNGVQGIAQLPCMLYVLGFGPRLPDDVVLAEGQVVPDLAGQMVVQVWRIAVPVAPAVPPAVPATVGVLDTYQNLTSNIGQPKPYLQFSDFRAGIVIDGSFMLDILSSDGGSSDFLRVLPLQGPYNVMSSVAAAETSVTDLLNVDRINNFKISLPVRNSATGSFVVPGDWGVRVNE